MASNMMWRLGLTASSLGLLLLVMASLASATFHTPSSDTKLAAPGAKPAVKIYIVYLGAAIHGGAHERTVAHHRSILQTVLPSKAAVRQSVVYHYVKSFSGFAATLSEQQAAVLKNHPDVVSVFESGIRQLATTKSWTYLGLNLNSGLWPASRYGDGVIIGLLDSGIWPESASFSDESVPLAPIPAKWKGSCQSADDFPVSSCNKKLIGAKVFLTAYQMEANGGDHTLAPELVMSPRDAVGHGTHTASTAAGSPVANASLHGVAKGTAVGGAPHAHVAMYKVCGFVGCYDADILAGFDEAVADRVDIISVSLGGDPFQDLLTDSITIGSFHALTRNILVSASAGNSGPYPGLVTNTAPWLLTVAASTIKRDFVTAVHLGDGSVVKGVSINVINPKRRSYPLVSGRTAGFDDVNVEVSRSCAVHGLDPEKVKDKIVFCEQYHWYYLDYAVLSGAAGVILGGTFLDIAEGVAFPTPFPSSCVTSDDARLISSYITSTRNPTAVILKTTDDSYRPAPQVIGFSSRGPSYSTPQVLKPDITAPGVNILAAWAASVPIQYGVGSYDAVFSDFNIISGTSMSCPHAAGAAALLMALHPTWSVAAVKSALITTATPLSRSLDTSNEGAFAYGAGQINPNAAADPGLVYDSGEEDYALFLCSIGHNSTEVELVTGKRFACPSAELVPPAGDLNYPSITVMFPVGKPGATGKVSITRRVTNVGPPRSVYRLSSLAVPEGTSVMVSPTTLAFTKQNQELSFVVNITAPLSSSEFPMSSVFGSLTWADDAGHYVTSPIVVSRIVY